MSSQRIDRPILNSIYSMYGYMRALPALWRGNKIMFVDVYLTYLFILGYDRYDESLRAPIHLVLPAAFGPRIAPIGLRAAHGGTWVDGGKHEFVSLSSRAIKNL